MVTIVGIPAVDERVWKVSSEKVPHLTMLQLGDVSNMELVDLVTFVQHAAQHLSPFYLTVDYRDTLGPKNADVLFFEDNMWEMPDIKQFRFNLLQNDTIRTAYESVEQFPDWQPHLTLGYPETPAKEDPEERAIHMVSFDKIGIWVTDYDGPEIRLKHRQSGLEVAMSGTSRIDAGAAAAEAVLEHHGVKGMRWGYTMEGGKLHSTGARQKESLLVRGSKDASVTQRRAGQYVQSKGGQRHKAADEAVRAQAARQIAKKSTTDALSNEALKKTIERMNLEQQFHTLNKKTIRQTRGQRFVQALRGSDTAKSLAKQAFKTRKDGSVVGG